MMMEKIKLTANSNTLAAFLSALRISAVDTNRPCCCYALECTPTTSAPLLSLMTSNEHRRAKI